MRKGIHATYAVAGFAVFGMVVIVSILVFLSLKDVYEKTEENARCSSQIRAHATMVSFTSDLKTPKIVCPTEVVLIPPNDDPNPILAQQMKRCWDTWGKGQLQLFGREEGLYCHVCSMSYIAGGEVRGFDTYLDEQKISPLGDTYTGYFTGAVSGAKFVDDARPGSVSVLPATDPIAVIYYHAKGQDGIDKVYNAVVGTPRRTTIVAAVAGAIIGGVAVFAAVPSGGGSLIAGAVLVGKVTTGVVAGAAAGGSGGFFASLFGREDLDSMSAIVVRPLNVQNVSALGCTYAPVANA